VAIKAVAMDVDGVLTDGTVWLDEAGRESKRIAFADIMGVSLGRRAGLHFALISGEGGALFDVIAAKLGITDTYPGCKDKAAALRDFAARHELDLAEVCFIGDDVNDVAALEICGLAATPAGAMPVASAMASMVTSRPGGEGAVREVVDYLLPEGDGIHHGLASAASPPLARRRGP
jgi:3-deoxy-D-manno-octulosonate 8-phosphate phosphatase (KDO 8-P phosphatase)